MTILFVYKMYQNALKAMATYSTCKHKNSCNKLTNFVALCQTVWAYEGSQNFGVHWGPAPSDGAWHDPYQFSSP